METNPLGLLAFLLTLAAIVEGSVEYFLSPIARLKPYLMYVGGVAGVVLAVVYQVDVLAVIFNWTSSSTPWIGYVLTGILIGRGSNFLNDFVSKYLKPTPAPTP